MYSLILITLITWLQATLSQDWNGDDYLKREHSLIKPYQGVGTVIPHWDFLGSTMVTNNYIRLTSDVQSLQGAIWNKIPCFVQHWEMKIHFKVHGKGKDLYGDGFSFWYVKEPMQSGPVFGSKDYFIGLAVIADTYSNHNGAHNHVHPYISAMINNGSLHYDHDRDGTHTQLAGCGAKFRNVEDDTHLSVKYYKDTLTVSTKFDKSGDFIECFSVRGVVLPTGYFFGLSAATGGLSDTHDVISLRLFDLTSPEVEVEDRSNVAPYAAYFEAPRDHVEDPRPSSLTTWKKVLLLIFGVIAICGCVFIGGLFYSKQQEQRRKRFY